MVNWFNHLYPYTNLHELNIDWVINQIKANEETIKNFTRFNLIKYADPIIWDITSQYEANTVVIDGQTGNAYISVQAVPYGVALDDTDYWCSIFNYSGALDEFYEKLKELREQIAAANETSTTATSPRSIGDLVWLDGKLAKIIANMIAGDTYVENSNFIYTTLEDEVKFTYYPQQEVLEFNAIINGEYDIVTGDVHVYHPGTSTIEITHE